MTRTIEVTVLSKEKLDEWLVHHTEDGNLWNYMQAELQSNLDYDNCPVIISVREE